MINKLRALYIIGVTVNIMEIYPDVLRYVHIISFLGYI